MSKDLFYQKAIDSKDAEIEFLEAKLAKTEKALEVSLEANRFYASDDSYDHGEDDGAPGTWRLLVGEGYGVQGDEFVLDRGKTARKAEKEIEKILGGSDE